MTAAVSAALKEGTGAQNNDLVAAMSLARDYLDAGDMAGALLAVQRVDKARTDWKLEKFEKNKYVHFTDDLKQIYATRDNVRSEEDFAKIENDLCHNCADDAPSMPHQVCRCPFDHENSEPGGG